MFVDIRTKISYEDAKFRSSILAASVSETTARSPVQLERPIRVRNHLPIELKSLSSGLRGLEIDETVSSVASNY
jgi:hypothetical protein